jgi:hypothetical protein
VAEDIRALSDMSFDLYLRRARGCEREIEEWEKVKEG